MDTVTIGTVGSPSANLWPLFIGIDKGFFTAENIKADLIYIPASAPAIQQLAAGSLDMSFSTGLVDPIRAVEQGAGVIAWIFVGLIAGYLASRLVNKTGEGTVRDIILGIIGGIVGGILFRALGHHGVSGFNIWSILVAFLGSVAVLILYHTINGRRRSV